MLTKKLLCGAVALGILLGQAQAAPSNTMNDGQRENKGIKQVKEDFADPAQKYAPYEFFFFDQDPDTIGIKGQDMAHELSQKGFNPGYAHARANYAQSMGGGGSHVFPITEKQWLSGSWFTLFEQQLKQAKTDGTHFTFTDEFGWPSFKAGGKMLEQHPELRAQSLSYTCFDVPAGEEIMVPGGAFAVAGKLVSTQNTSFVTFQPAYNANKSGGDSANGWYRMQFHKEYTSPWQDSAIPYNNSCAYTDAGSGNRWAQFQPYILNGGTYEVFGTWHDSGANASNVVYNINGTPVTVNQRENCNQWNSLGTFAFEAGGGQTITIDNKANGRVVIDAIKLVNIADANDTIVIDEQHTTDRKIGYLDSSTLSLIGEGDAFVWKAPSDGAYRVYAFRVVSKNGYDGSPMNFLDSTLADKFLDIAYKPYTERFKDYMGPGKTMNGAFSDHEGDYGYKMAYSKDLEQLYKEKTGEDMRPLLPLLIDRDVQGKDAKVRFDWFDAVSDLYTANVAKVADYAQDLGMYYTMHTWEETLQFQAGTVGDYFKLNRAITLPGTDALEQVAYNPTNFKETQSIADLEGRRYMDEVAALLPAKQYTPSEMKKQANFLAAYGVGHVVAHSVKMTREKAQVYVTPDFYNIDPNWDFMGQWTDFVRRTSYINSNGRINAQVLLLNPMDSIWSLAEGDFFDMGYELHSSLARYGGTFPGEAGEINRLYQQAIRQLTRNRVEHLSVDKYYVNKMAVEDGALTLDGRSFRTVVLPPMTVIDENVAQKLLAFAKSGGYVYYLGSLPTGSIQNGREDAAIRSAMESLRALPTVFYTPDLGKALQSDCPGLESQVQFIDGAFNLLSHYRLIDGKHVIFVTNNTDESHTSTLYIPHVTGQTELLNPQDGTIQAANAATNRDGTQVSLSFAPNQAYYILIDPSQPPQASTQEVYSEQSGLSTPWRASIDKGNASETLEHTFAPVTTDKLRIVLQKGSFDAPETASISELSINGGKVTYMPTASSGENCKAISDGNPDTVWKNAAPIVLDEVQWIECQLEEETPVESVRISSGPGVPLIAYRIEAWDGFWWKTVAQLDTVSQPELNQKIAYPAQLLNGTNVTLSNWNTWSFLPNKFAGCIDYTNTMQAVEGQKTYIELSTAEGGAQVWVNGKSAGARLTPPFRYDITDLLIPGENTVRIRVANTIGSNSGNAAGGLTAFRVLTASERPFVADTSKGPMEKPALLPSDSLPLPKPFDPSTLPLELVSTEVETAEIEGISYEVYEAELSDFGPGTVGASGVSQPGVATNQGNAFGGGSLGWWPADGYVNFAVKCQEDREAELLLSYSSFNGPAELIVEANGQTYRASAPKTTSFQDYQTVSVGNVPLHKGLNVLRVSQNPAKKLANIDALLVRSTHQKESVSISLQGIKADPEALYGTGKVQIQARIVSQAEAPLLLAAVYDSSGALVAAKQAGQIQDGVVTLAMPIEEAHVGGQLKVMVWESPAHLRPLCAPVQRTLCPPKETVYTLVDTATFDNEAFDQAIWLKNSSNSGWAYVPSGSGKALRLNTDAGAGWGGFLTKNALEDYKVEGKLRTVYNPKEGSAALCARMNTNQANRGLACAPSYANQSVVGGSGGKGTVYFAFSYAGQTDPSQRQMSVILMDKDSGQAEAFPFALPEGVNLTEETAFSLTDTSGLITLECNGIFVAAVDTASKTVLLPDGTKTSFTAALNAKGAFGAGGHVQAVYLDDISLYTIE